MYRHLFDQGGSPRVWVSSEAHAFGLVRTVNPSNNEVGGEGLIKAFKKEDREHAIEFAKRQREEPIHRGYKLKLVRLTAEEFTPVAQASGGRSGGSHADCDHPATPAARRECRARRRSGV